MSISDNVSGSINNIIEKKLQSGDIVYIRDIYTIMDDVFLKNTELFNSKPSQIKCGCNIYSLPNLNCYIIDPQTGIVKGIKK